MTDKTPTWQRWLLLFAATATIGFTSALGIWQLDRAQEKFALQLAREEQAAKEVLDGHSLEMTGEAVSKRKELIHRRMVLRGRWLPKYTVYLDNRQMNGKPGFFVMTPMQLEGSQVALLVQRGWVQRSFVDRAHLPEVQTPGGLVEVNGNLALWPSRLYDFGGVQTGPIRQNLELEIYKKETALDLLEVSLQQSGVASEGLLREWSVVSSGVEKHHGYAFQWFGLSGLIALLYVWFQIVQPRRQKRPA